MLTEGHQNLYRPPMLRIAGVVFFVWLAAFAADSIAQSATAPPLAGIRVVSGRLVDDLGRTIVLRGINAVDKNGWRGTLAAPIVTPADLATLSAAGFNHLRLGLTWDSVEHSRGTYDEDYANLLLDVLDDVAAAGFVAVVDVHQDVWSRYIGGSDGAPAWADPQCNRAPRLPLRETTGIWFAQYFSPDVQSAWNNFWADGYGALDPHCTGAVQTSFVQMWTWLAGKLGGHAAVAGYDLLNEPWPGAPPVAFEATMLTPFYARLAAAIRAVDAATPLFFEPPIWKSATVPTFGLEPPDANSVFAPHIYTETMFSEGRLSTGARSDELVLLTDVEEARRMDVPVWIGEWGAFENDATPEYVSAMYDLFDRYRVGSAYWRYAQYPGEAWVTGTRLDAHARVYPEAYPGEAEWSYEPSSRTFTMTMTIAEGDATTARLVVPDALDIDTSSLTAAGGARYLWTVSGFGTHWLTLGPDGG